MKTTLIKNATIVNEGEVFVSDLYLKDGLISEIAQNITKFINNEFFAQDSRAFRTHYMDSMPDLSFDIEYVCPNCTTNSDMTLPIQTNFFWPSR